MSFDPSANAFNCFLSYPTIARWSGVSLASVKRVLQKHGDGPAPLVIRSKPGYTRGYRHACYRFTLVQYPERLAIARDASRAGRLEQMGQALRDLQPERIALQRQREDFGGTLTEAEYARKLEALENAVKRKTPARAVLKRTPSSHERGARRTIRAHSDGDSSPLRHDSRVLGGVKTRRDAQTRSAS
jgi:hypothetical protein